MKFQINKYRWRLGGALVLTGMFCFGSPVIAENAQVRYPVKRFVTGQVMSVSLPFEKGRNGEISVNEKVYRVLPKTVMVDQDEHKTALNFFEVGNWVYMVVELYPDHREALYIAPGHGQSEGPIPGLRGKHSSSNNDD
ncbi:MAG: hypothetical protein HY200_04470 [Nitrospirae bacterium]|nr:hypothetical protein [Nitrospirota bacterium]MBI3594190.1 hypothetical protein [Nitrospirota bacterium]